MKKSIKTHARLLVCLMAFMLVFATFLVGPFTTEASTDVFGDIELKVGDTLGFVYYTSQPYTESTEMRFTVNGRTSTSPAYQNDGKCVFIFNDIYPHELAHEVTATIVVNGNEKVSSTGLSIKNFLLQMLLDPNTSEDEKKFASDTLQYGEQTRLYRNANVDVADMDFVSITDDINTSIYTKYAPQDIDAVMAGSATGLGVSASNIRLSSIGIAYHNTNYYVVTLQVPTNSNVDLSKIKVQIGDKTFTHQDFTYKANGQYEIKSNPINAYDIITTETATETVTETATQTYFTLFVNDTPVQQAKYSVLDYIYQLQDTTQDNSLALKYARSLYRYGQSAEKAYKGNRIVAIALNKGPGDDDGQMPINSQAAQTPTGGSITAYYSDGTFSEITEGIVWKNTDIHGNEIKITDDTHTKKFTVEGSYYDDTSGKTYTVTGTIELHNDMESVARYTDPDVLDTNTATKEQGYMVSGCTPQNAQLWCTWNNGFTAARTANKTNVPLISYMRDEYGFIPVTLSYTDPNSKVTLSTTAYLLYINPIDSITINSTTAEFDVNNPNSITTPKPSSYTVTYANGLTSNRTYNTDEVWSNTIQDGDDEKNVSYSFVWDNLAYEGYEIKVNLTATGKLIRPTFGPWGRMKEGNIISESPNSESIVADCVADTTNKEIGITIQTTPSVCGGTITNADALSGNPSSKTNGQLTGGTVYMQYANSAKEKLSASAVAYTTDDTIIDTAYSKQVDVTATYVGKNGQTYTADKQMTIYNWMKGITQSTNAIAPAGDYNHKNVAVPISCLKNTIQITYCNGATTMCQNTNDLTVYLGDQSRADWYVPNITTGEIKELDATSQAAGALDSKTYSPIVVSYTDSRTDINGNKANYNSGNYKTTQIISEYKVVVRNDVKNFGTNAAKVCKITAANKNEPKLMPEGTVSVTLSNNKTLSVTPQYTAVDTITTADETVTRTSDMLYISKFGKHLSGRINVTVVNEITSVVLHTDPEAITVTSTSSISEGQVTGCKLSATYINGKTGEIVANKYTGLGNAKITDATRYKQYDITAGYSSSYSAPKAVNAKLTLLNPPKTDKWTIQNVTLKSSGVQPERSVTITFSNQTSTIYPAQNISISTIYKSGTTNSSTTATTEYTGSCNVTATITFSSFTYSRYESGSSKNITQDGITFTKTQSVTWTNPPTTLSNIQATCTAVNHTTTKVTPTATATVTLANGAQLTKQTLKCSQVDNITDATAESTKYFTASYTNTSGVTIQQDKVPVVVKNPITKYSPDTLSGHFPSAKTLTYNNIKGKLIRANGKTAQSDVYADSISNFQGDDNTKIIFSSAVNDNKRVSVTASINTAKHGNSICAQDLQRTGTWTVSAQGYTGTLYFTAINSGTLVAYSGDSSTSTQVPNNKTSDKGLYPNIHYMANSKTGISSYSNMNLRYKYDSGAYVLLKLGDVTISSVVYPTINSNVSAKTLYGPSDSWSSDNLKQYTVTYNGQQTSFFAMPYTTATSAKYYAKGVNMQYSGATTQSVSASYLTIKYSSYSQYHYGCDRNGSSSSETTKSGTATSVHCGRTNIGGSTLDKCKDTSYSGTSTGGSGTACIRGCVTVATNCSLYTACVLSSATPTGGTNDVCWSASSTPSTLQQASYVYVGEKTL